MTVRNVRVTDLIKLLVRFMAKGHQYVDIEVANSLERPNTLTVYPARNPIKLNTLEEQSEKEDQEMTGPLDEDTISQIIF